MARTLALAPGLVRPLSVVPPVVLALALPAVSAVAVAGALARALSGALAAGRFRAGSGGAVRSLLTGTVLLLLLGAGPAAAQQVSPMVVLLDQGGLLAERRDRIAGLRHSGRRVELRGICYSSCTLYLDLPNACVAPVADFGFHGPTRGGHELPPEEFEFWSRFMADHYREPLRSWFLDRARHRRGDYLRLRGAELIRLGYPSC